MSAVEGFRGDGGAVRPYSTPISLITRNNESHAGAPLGRRTGKKTQDFLWILRGKRERLIKALGCGGSSKTIARRRESGHASRADAPTNGGGEGQLLRANNSLDKTQVNRKGEGLSLPRL